jgi:hypothetical protein
MVFLAGSGGLRAINLIASCFNDAANPGGGIRHRDRSTGKSYVAKVE